MYFWAAIVGFFLGIAGAELMPIGIALPLFLLQLGIVIWASSPRRFAAVVAIFLISLGIGATRVYIADTRSESPLDQLVGQSMLFTGRVVAEPDKRDTTVRLTVAPGGYGRTPHILVPVSLPATFTYGDMVRVSGVLSRPEAFEGSGGRIFDYPHYLAAQGIAFEMPHAEVERIQIAPWSVRGTLFSIKQSYLSGLESGLPQPYAGLAGGITVGDKRSLGKELTDDFRRTGLVHIIVLSGYNMTLIVGAMMLLVRGTSRWARFVFGISIILAFVVMTGASATSIRAGAMAGLALFAVVSLRMYAVDRALALTALAMVLWNPHTLLYDPGFQLSVLATIGLVHTAPFFETYLRWVPTRFELRSIAAATLGTQSAVLPLLVYQMGLLSVISLPANLLVLPAIPLAMITSFIAGVVGALNATLGFIVGIPAYVLLLYVVRMTQWFAAVPFGAIEIPVFSAWIVVFVYAAVVAIVLVRNVSQPQTN
ncbi:ComEC/Rec2 family competence protein [Candidatus Kaiserbacteria bacterium]|nr:ComEC/Rec2 family competence protein [Candidatus Kaiserbacteria bacterium]